jgi:hypothetical protein
MMLSDMVIHQQQFARMLGKMLGYITDSTPYAMTLGELMRTPEQAALNASKGVGIKNSLHCDKMAIEIYFWHSDHMVPVPQEAFNMWRELGGNCGADFGDMNHFSLVYGGRK